MNVSETSSPQISLEIPKEKKRISGWWWVLFALPVGFIFQIIFNTTLNHILDEGFERANLFLDAFILIRSIVGLIWQPKSADWKWYLAFLPASVPLLWIIGAFDASFSHNHPF